MAFGRNENKNEKLSGDSILKDAFLYRLTNSKYRKLYKTLSGLHFKIC